MSKSRSRRPSGKGGERSSRSSYDKHRVSREYTSRYSGAGASRTSERYGPYRHDTRKNDRFPADHRSRSSAQNERCRGQDSPILVADDARFPESSAMNVDSNESGHNLPQVPPAPGSSSSHNLRSRSNSVTSNNDNNQGVAGPESMHGVKQSPNSAVPINNNATTGKRKLLLTRLSTLPVIGGLEFRQLSKDAEEKQRVARKTLPDINTNKSTLNKEIQEQETFGQARAAARRSEGVGTAVITPEALTVQTEDTIQPLTSTPTRDASEPGPSSAVCVYPKIEFELMEEIERKALSLAMEIPTVKPEPNTARAVRDDDNGEAEVASVIQEQNPATCKRAKLEYQEDRNGCTLLPAQPEPVAQIISDDSDNGEEEMPPQLSVPYVVPPSSIPTIEVIPDERTLELIISFGKLTAESQQLAVRTDENNRLISQLEMLLTTLRKDNETMKTRSEYIAHTLHMMKTKISSTLGNALADSLSKLDPMDLVRPGSSLWDSAQPGANNVSEGNMSSGEILKSTVQSNTRCEDAINQCVADSTLESAGPTNAIDICIQAHSDVIILVKFFGNYVYTSSKDGTVKRTPFVEDSARVVLYEHNFRTKDYATFVEVYQPRKDSICRVITASTDSVVRLFEGDTGILNQCVEQPLLRTITCGFVAWKKMFFGGPLTCSQDASKGGLIVLNVLDLKLIQRTQNLPDVPQQLVVLPDASGFTKAFLVISNTGSITIRHSGNLFTLKVLIETVPEYLPVKREPVDTSETCGSTTGIQIICAILENKIVVAKYGENFVFIYGYSGNLEAKVDLQTISPSCAGVKAMVVSGPFLACGFHNNIVKIFKLKTLMKVHGKKIPTVNLSTDQLLECLDFTLRGRVKALVSGGSEGVVKILSCH